MKDLRRFRVGQRPAWDYFLTVGLVFLFLALGTSGKAGNRNAYPLPENRGTAGILAALEKLPRYIRVLHTTAHPDDEGAATLSWLARKAHARTALFSLTRGDGGQNVLGDEKYEAMGMLRTGELLEACKIYGVETYFATVFEFGFSKSAQETLSKWGHEATLEELVRFIRTWRPTVIISKWQGTSRDGHGHHQAAGLLTHEAFRAAGDPTRFPEHLQKGISPWQAKKLYRNTRGDAETGTASAAGSQSDPDWTVRINVGAYDPVLGRSFREIGSEGYSKHRSQGNAASFSLGGRAYDYYKLMDSTGGAKDREESFFDSIDTSLLAILDLAGPARSAVGFLQKDLSAAHAAAEEAIRAFRPQQPAASAPAAVKGVAILTESIRRVENSELSQKAKEVLQDALMEKLRDFQDAANAALGIYLVSRTDDPTAVPGQKVPVTTYFFNRGSELVELTRITLLAPEGWKSNLPSEPPFGQTEPGGQATFRHSVDVSANAKITEPFWYRTGNEDTRYKIRPTRNVFAAFGEPEIVARATYRYKDTEVSVTAPTLAQVSDPLRGVDFRDFQIVPALSLTMNPGFVVAPVSDKEQSRQFQVAILSNERSEVRGNLKVSHPDGWQVEPAAAPFVLARKGESFTARFKLRIPPGARQGTFPVEAIAITGGREFRQGYQVVSYPENWTRHLYSPSRASIKIFDVRVAPQLTVGYVMGAGDEVPASLEQLGVKVEMLSGADLAFGELNRFNAIVTGVRAYNVNEDLKAHNQRLLNYVEQGGTLIVQYNTPARGPASQFSYGPFPMSMSGSDRITVEDSPVKILEPQNAIFTAPNQITQADFEGWVQERGLYFMRQWDPRYTALLSGNDPGEEPKNGGFLVARHGKGHYVFTAYAWFRQLPSGVPGAFRIFANMLSLGR